MATRNFVPRADGEGSIGTAAKNWGNGFFKKAAIGALTKAVSVLVPADDANDQQPATTSWVRARFRSILETVLSAAGLKYNIASNGYICFGALFGNLILQWGVVWTNSSDKSIRVNFNVNNNIGYLHASIIRSSKTQADNGYCRIDGLPSKDSFEVYFNNITSGDSTERRAWWLSIGY